MIRRAGPGKFDTVLDAFVYADSLDGGLDDEAGDVSEQGVWAGLIRGLGQPMIDSIEQFDAANNVGEGLTKEEKVLLLNSVGAIITENDQGFVVVNYFDDEDELNAEWKEISEELSADEIDEEFGDDTYASEADHRSLHERCAPDSQCQAVPRGKKLTRAQRDALPSGKFAIPERRAYPIPNAYHATLALTALARTAARNGKKPSDARKVLAAVRKKFPSVAQCECDLIDRVKRAHGI